MEQQYQSIAKEMNLSIKQVANTLELLSSGNTVPFIARYRKEVTQGLDEEQIRLISEQYEYEKSLNKRKEDVLRLIETQGKLTKEIISSIEKATKLSEVEDIYRPYQQKRKTRATEAAAKGLEPLADYIMQCPVEGNIEVEAKKYINDRVADAKEALAGARDIIAERVSDQAKFRQLVRYTIAREGVLSTSKKKDADDSKQVYSMYYEYSERVATLAPHRIMAINRGENEKVVSVSIQYDQDALIEKIFYQMILRKPTISENEIFVAVKDGCKRLLFSGIEREIRSDLTTKAQNQSIELFTNNVERLLVQPPLKDKTILGVDPAFRTGCKLAVIDMTGKALEISAIYPHQPVNKKEEALSTLSKLVSKYPIDIIAIGNGTASRETEAFIAQFIQTVNRPIAYTIVSESGASVYSASPLAKEEFPDLQVEQRSAISIARRLLDPLSELIKIDPQSIGVGQYQHALPTARLKERLDFAVSKVVNRVGVDINTASEHLLRHVSGLSKNSAKEIVRFRDSNGRFKQREQIKTVKYIGDKAFEQAAGFLRIVDGDQWLDATAIHPESYPLVYQLYSQLNLQQSDAENRMNVLKKLNITQMAKQLGTDEYTLSDIVDTLLQPLRDYRDQYDGPLLRQDVLSLDDLKEGMQLEGVVRNVVDFGAFVDIGLKSDGLVHISKMAKHRVKHPTEIVNIGDIITVYVSGVDQIRQKVQLSLLKELI